MRLAPPTLKKGAQSRLTAIPSGGSMDYFDDQEHEPRGEHMHHSGSEHERRDAQGQGGPPQGEPPMEGQRSKTGVRGTAAMDAATRHEVARKGGLAVSQNRQHMAEIGRKGGQTVSKNREHMANIGRKGGEASRGHR
jgi:general stress protein YciG